MKQAIFISSVQKELAEERRALKSYILGDALLGRFFDVFLFEDMPAADRRADKVYLSQVDRCDVYLGLLGNEYGYEDAQGVSPTEREFDRATAAGKQRLIFVKGENDAARHPKMQALVRKAGGQLIRRRFNNPSELTALAYSSLVEHLVNAGTVRTRPFDAAACPEAALDDLSRQKVQEFLARAQAERNYPLGPRTPTPKALAHLNLLDGEKPTHAAVLLFGRQPQRFLITSEVKCLQFHGTTVAKPIPDYRIFKGTVFELVDQALGFVMSKIAASVGTRADSSQAPVTYEFPRAAVAEAIVNAVAHRDYASNASVQVHDGVHDEVHDGVHDLHLTDLMRRLLARLVTPASTPELLKTLGYPRRTRNYSAAMKALLDAKMIAMSRPDAPRSKNQEYRLTDKGRASLSRKGGAKST